MGTCQSSDNLQVFVPPDVSPGQTITVKAFDTGKLFTAVVPDGCAPGSAFVVRRSEAHAEAAAAEPAESVAVVVTGLTPRRSAPRPDGVVVMGIPFQLQPKGLELEPLPTIQIVVPLGVSIGQILNVEPPDGEIFSVVVPPDFATPGSAFSVLRDAVRTAAVPGAVIVPGRPCE